MGEGDIRCKSSVETAGGGPFRGIREISYQLIAEADNRMAITPLGVNHKGLSQLSSTYLSHRRWWESTAELLVLLRCLHTI